MTISEIITDRYKLRIPPTVYYELLADVQELEEEQEPTTKNNLGVDCISRTQAQTEIEINASRYTIAKERGGMGQVEWSDQLIKVSDAVDIIRHLPSVTPQNQVHPLCEDCHTKMDEVRRAYDNAMKQEPILDKLRAEIVELTKCPYGTECLGANCPSNTDCMICGDHVLEILDKCKAEVEPQESEDKE